MTLWEWEKNSSEGRWFYGGQGWWSSTPTLPGSLGSHIVSWGCLASLLSQFSALECLLQPQGLGPGLKPQLLMEMASHSPHSLSYGKLSWSCWEACWLQTSHGSWANIILILFEYNCKLLREKRIKKSNFADILPVHKAGDILHLYWLDTHGSD